MRNSASGTPSTPHIMPDVRAFTAGSKMMTALTLVICLAANRSQLHVSIVCLLLIVFPTATGFLIIRKICQNLNRSIQTNIFNITLVILRRSAFPILNKIWSYRTCTPNLDRMGRYWLHPDHRGGRRMCNSSYSNRCYCHLPHCSMQPTY